MPEILIISDHLIMAGAERLIYELSCHAQSTGIHVTVLIANNYSKEYYDDILKEKNVKVIRTTLKDIGRLRNPFNLLRAVYWRLKLNLFAHHYYESVHVIGLYNVHFALDTVKHRHRFFWHVGNAIQYFGGNYDFAESCFKEKNDTIICINKYQVDELKSQYGESVKCKIVLFKLFLADI